MKNYYRHQLNILQIDMKIADFAIQKATWEEINEERTVLEYQEKINLLEQEKTDYLNQLFLSLHKTEITEENCSEIKLCYQLLEKYSKSEYSVLFTAHLNRTIEKHQKEYGSFLIKSQIKKAYEIENKIQILEKNA
ncbi:hypothetical protein [Flavobacterium sp. I3-2]|uniref:hypothetical protein n=1 Tax=Flavobacterium sp. I3-2 TaxID=2748319 RepID=UPI0015A920FA|nr:hypothetical protein [Flavobacterium sp. I3-2]